MRILVLGGDGYLGWPTSLHLSAIGHEVTIFDNLQRRAIDRELKTSSIVPITSPATRDRIWKQFSGRTIHRFVGSTTVYQDIEGVIETIRPDVIVHFAEQRSAPYSMIDYRHAVGTQHNNVLGTLNLIYAIAAVNPGIPLVKLGTLGEYGTPNIDIEEGWLDVEHNGRKDRVLYPKRAGSWYHLSKVHDSHNLEFACRAWGMRVTDLNQGVVYGHHTEQTDLHPFLATRFDYDAVFGTVLNRFAVQAALGHPLTVYGDGCQTRGFIDLRDTVRCIQLACENPPERGDFRVFNQLTETFSVNRLATRVARLSPEPVEIDNLSNPRHETSDHHYQVTHSALTDLGLDPQHLTDETITDLITTAKQNLHRINKDVLKPTVTWSPRVPTDA